MEHENHLTPAEKWERLTFADNYIFCKVMEESPDICKKMLELLLNLKIEQIEIPQMERTMKVSPDSKAIRLDVFVKDNAGKSYDIEVQTSVDKDLALLKRARYYQGLMDVDTVFAGDDYEVLDESYVLFLCIGDPFKFELPIYTFKDVCTELQNFSPKNKNDTVKLESINDGIHKVFFNAKKYDTMKSEELKSFFKYLCGKSPDSDFSEKISAIVKRIKMNPRWRHEYMTWEQEIKFQAKQAAKETRIETAQKLLDRGISTEIISECTGIPLEKVLELQKQPQTVKA